MIVEERGLTALDTATSELNAELARIERQFKQSAQRVMARVEVGGVELSWNKNGGEWGIWAAPPSSGAQPILKASRDTRVRAVEGLSALFEAIKEAAEAEELRVRAALNRARGLSF